MSTMTTIANKGRIDIRGVFPALAGSSEIRAALTGLAKDVAKHAPKGARFTWQKVGPVLMDHEGRAAINAHTRKIKNRHASAKALDEGSDEQLRVISQEQDSRKARQRARRLHDARLTATHGPIASATVLVGQQLFDFSLTFGAIAQDLSALTALTCGGITAMGLVGKRIDGGAKSTRAARKRSINDELLREVLSNLGIPALVSKINDVKPAGLAVDDKTKAERTLRLPMNTNVTQVQNKHEMFAANLDVHPDCLLLERGESASRLVIKISKVSPSKRKQGSWTQSKAFDIFGDLTIGENVVGESMTTSIPASLLAFGKSGWGKSVLLRLIMAEAIQDPLLDLYLAAPKGLGDFKGFDQVAKKVIAGHGSRSDIVHEILLLARHANAKAAERTEILSQLGEPEVTRELAEKHPELRPILFVLDELGLLFLDENEGSKVANEMLKLLGNCRSNGIRVVAATQKFNDVIDSKFPGAFSNVAVFKTSEEWNGRTILGNDSHSRGFKPFDFNQRGEVVLQGDDDEDLQRGRVFPITERQQRDAIASGLAKRGGAVRKVTLKTVATVVNVTKPTSRPIDRTTEQWIDDVIVVTADVADETKLQDRQILERLQTEFPGRYDDCKPVSVTAVLGGAGVAVIDQVFKRLPDENGVPKGTNRKGVLISNVRDLKKAVAA